jgi:phosphoribosylformylglycinamidine synthase
MGLIEGRRLVALRYCDERGRPTMEFPENPNGSVASAAGVCDPSGRVFGLMPHPEAAVSIYQYPDWTRRREEARLRGEPLPEEGDGLRIFKNARAYVG